MAEHVEIKAKVVQTEVKALVLRHKKALEERECELLWKVSSYFHGWIPTRFHLTLEQLARNY